MRDELARHAPACEWITVEQAAALLGVTAKAVYSKLKRGALTAHRFDGRVYLSRCELDEAIRDAPSS
ncbi:MAG: helix-turn-helix domain-containing protein [Gaiellales bacterium]